ncbi:MAG: hypothetical protein ACYS8X_11355 [Planctomycetota bacterium]
MAVIEATFDEDRDLVTQTVIGEVTVDEILRRVMEMIARKPTSRVLWDFSTGSLAAISAEEFRRMAEEGRAVGELRAGGKTAVVVGKDVDFGLMRMFASLAEAKDIPVEFRSFHSMAEARRWLGIED